MNGIFLNNSHVYSITIILSRILSERETKLSFRSRIQKSGFVLTSKNQRFPQSARRSRLVSSVAVVPRLLRLLELRLSGIALRLRLVLRLARVARLRLARVAGLRLRLAARLGAHLRLDSVRFLVFADGPVVLAPLRRVVRSWLSAGGRAARTHGAAVLRRRSLLQKK